VEAKLQWPLIYWSILLANGFSFVGNIIKIGKKLPKKIEKMNERDGTDAYFRSKNVEKQLLGSSLLDTHAPMVTARWFKTL
jgi:hypothetical protein